MDTIQHIGTCVVCHSESAASLVYGMPPPSPSPLVHKTFVYTLDLTFSTIHVIGRYVMWSNYSSIDLRIVLLVLIGTI